MCVTSTIKIYFRIVSIQISSQGVSFRTPEIPMFNKTGRLPFVSLCIGSPEITSVQPQIAFGYTLEEHAEIPTFPCRIQCQTEFIARSIITDNAIVTCISQFIASVIYFSVSIKVSIHNITCTPVTSQCRLVYLCQMCIHFFLTLSNANSGQSPNISQHSAFVVLADIHTFIRVTGNLLLVI